jgi:hypothetical protein
MTTHSISKFRISLFAAVLAFAPIAHSQDVGMTGKINVPFAFETSTGQHFNAGVYTLQIENLHTLQIKGQSAAGLVMTTIEDNAQPSKTGKATFRKYGSQYFLSDIVIAGKSRRLSLLPAKMARQLQIAAQETAPSAPVELALLGTAR